MRADERTEKPRFAPRTGLFVFLAALALYLALPTSEYYWDGIAYAINAERGGPFDNPNHVSFTRAVSGIYRLLTAAGLSVRALTVMQWLSAISGAAAVLFIWLETRSLSTTALFAVSATWWRFATDANRYVPAVALCLAAWRILPRALPAALLHAVAMTVHQLSVFFAPAAAWVIYRDRGIRAAVTYLATASVTTIAAYWLAWRAEPSAPFLTWLTYHSPDSAFSFDPLRSIFLTARGTLRLFLGGKIGDFEADAVSYAALFLLLGAFVLVWKTAPSRSRLRNEPRASGTVKKSRIDPDEADETVCPTRPVNTLPKVGRAVSPAQRDFFTVPSGSDMRDTQTVLLRWRSLRDVRLQWTPALLLWIGAFVAFLFVWLPQNTFYRLFYLPPLLLLFRAPDRALAPLVAAVALWNFTFFIWPHAQPENNAPLAQARRMEGVWPPGTTVLISVYHPDLWTISYFHPQSDWIQFDGKPETAEAFRAARNSLWIEGSAYDTLSQTPEGRAWLEKHTKPAGASGPARFWRVV